jgi:hypothetical protein
MSSSTLSATLRGKVAERAGYCCEYCCSQLKFSPDPFSVEHIIPRAAGGTDELDNLALACQGCNGRKYTSTEAIDPASGAVVSLYNPRHQVWSEHFAWSEDFALIIGITPIGRATVADLELNREGVTNLRRILRAEGQHPPLLFG